MSTGYWIAFLVCSAVASVCYLLGFLFNSGVLG